jgi:hypothetical protein
VSAARRDHSAERALGVELAIEHHLNKYSPGKARARLTHVVSRRQHESYVFYGGWLDGPPDFGLCDGHSGFPPPNNPREHMSVCCFHRQTRKHTTSPLTRGSPGGAAHTGPEK